MDLHGLLSRPSNRIPKELISSFNRDSIQSSIKNIRFAIILCVLLFAGFAILDFYTVPQLYKYYWAIRFLIVIPFSLMVIAISYFPIFLRQGQLFLSLLSIVGGYSILWMIWIAPVEVQNTYYVGVILVLMFFFTFLRLRFVYGFLTGIILFVGFEIGMVSSGVDNLTIVNNSYFMAGALFIGILSSYFHEKLLRKEFLLRRTLEQEKRKTEAINSSLEDRVEERTRRLQEMNDQLKDAKLEAEKSDQLKSAFLANMSHEIRTPMNSILGFTEILSDDEIEKEQNHKYLSIIHSNSLRLLQIINDIIDISKIESGSVDISPTSFKPSKIIGEVLDLFGSIEMNPNGIEILSEYPKESDSEIFTDYTKLIQILVNLSQNAVKYTPKGQVKIGYKREHKDSICFYVYDTGIGISEEDQKTIFNRFTQVKIDRKTPNKGVGLGLAITQANTNLIQGKIKLTSALGKGSRFEINLPMRYSTPE